MTENCPEQNFQDFSVKNIGRLALMPEIINLTNIYYGKNYGIRTLRGCSLRFFTEQ